MTPGEQEIYNNLTSVWAKMPQTVDSRSALLELMWSTIDPNLTYVLVKWQQDYRFELPPEIANEVREALNKLDSSTKSAVALLTDMTPEEITEIGGIASDEA